MSVPIRSQSGSKFSFRIQLWRSVKPGERAFRVTLSASVPKAKESPPLIVRLAERKSSDLQVNRSACLKTSREQHLLSGLGTFPACKHNVGIRAFDYTIDDGIRCGKGRITNAIWKAQRSRRSITVCFFYSTSAGELALVGTGLSKRLVPAVRPASESVGKNSIYFDDNIV